MSFVFWLYRFLSILIAPLVRLWVYVRLGQGLEEREHLKERFGCHSIKRPEGRVLWFHAASVGETVSLIPLLKSYKAQSPEDNLLLTTTTVTAAKIAQQRLKGICFHQYVPFDVYPWIDRFLKYWQPSLAVFVESEVWPNIITQSKRRGIPLVLLNASLSDRSYQRWCQWRWFATLIFKNFDLCMAPFDETLKRLKDLGADRVEPSPHLKFAAEPLPFEFQQLDFYRSLIKNRPVWVVASTHPGEEEKILEAHQRLKKHFPSLLTILIPRHPHRAETILDMCYEQGETKETACLHTEQRPNADTAILLVNTIGELGLFYRLSPIVFIGGSFMPVGGHNPIEPAMLGCVVLYGPHMHNFRNICQILQDVTVSVATVDKLVEMVTHLLSHQDAAFCLGKKASETVLQQAESLDGIVTRLLKISHQKPRE